jgi:hypothetical protein
MIRSTYCWGRRIRQPVEQGRAVEPARNETIQTNRPPFQGRLSRLTFRELGEATGAGPGEARLPYPAQPVQCRGHRRMGGTHDREAIIGPCLCLPLRFLSSTTLDTFVFQIFIYFQLISA